VGVERGKIESIILRVIKTLEETMNFEAILTKPVPPFRLTPMINRVPDFFSAVSMPMSMRTMGMVSRAWTALQKTG
jgi:hypothetical protein